MERAVVAGKTVGATGALGGIIAIVIFLSNILGALDRNCRATERIGAATVGIVSVDNELSKAANKDLRLALIRQLKAGGCK